MSTCNDTILVCRGSFQPTVENITEELCLAVLGGVSERNVREYGQRCLKPLPRHMQRLFKISSVQGQGHLAASQYVVVVVVTTLNSFVL